MHLNCDAVYNIYNVNDIVGHRTEPLVSKKFTELKPVSLNYGKGLSGILNIADMAKNNSVEIQHKATGLFETFKSQLPTFPFSP